MVSGGLHVLDERDSEEDLALDSRFAPAKWGLDLDKISTQDAFGNLNSKRFETDVSTKRSTKAGLTLPPAYSGATKDVRELPHGLLDWEYDAGKAGSVVAESMTVSEEEQAFWTSWSRGEVELPTTGNEDEATTSSGQQDARGKAVVLYDRKTRRKGELTLRRGQLVFVSYRYGEWFVAQNISTHERGTVPGNYLRFIKPSERDIHHSSIARFKNGEVKSEGAGRVLAKALYDFERQASSELPLHASDLVLVEKKVSQDWLWAEHIHTHHKGWVPGTYLRVLTDIELNSHHEEYNAHAEKKSNEERLLPVETSLARSEQLAHIPGLETAGIETTPVSQRHLYLYKGSGKSKSIKIVGSDITPGLVGTRSPRTLYNSQGRPDALTASEPSQDLAALRIKLEFKNTQPAEASNVPQQKGADAGPASVKIEEASASKLVTNLPLRLRHRGNWSSCRTEHITASMSTPQKRAKVHPVIDDVITLFLRDSQGPPMASKEEFKMAEEQSSATCHRTDIEEVAVVRLTLDAEAIKRDTNDQGRSSELFDAIDSSHAAQQSSRSESSLDGSRTTQQSLKDDRKGTRGKGSEDDESFSDDDKRPNQRFSGSNKPEHYSKRLLACPYAKHD